MKRKNLKLLTLTSALCAAIFVITAYLHIPTHTGYTHVGDAIVFFAGAVLPLPYAVFAAGVGGLLADLLSGYAIWAPGTVIIKSLTVLFFSRRASKIITKRNLLALIPAWALCIGGYYLYECIIVGNLISPLAGIPGYIVQSALSSVLFVALGFALDRLNFKKRFIGDI